MYIHYVSTDDRQHKTRFPLKGAIMSAVARKVWGIGPQSAVLPTPDQSGFLELLRVPLTIC